MYTLWKLTIASLKMFVRNRQALFFTFFTPLLIMVIFGAIGFNSAPKISVGIVLEGNIGVPSEYLLKGVQSIPSFKLFYGSQAEEKQALLEGNRAVVVDVSHMSDTLPVYVNGGDSSSQIALSIINQLIDRASLMQANLKPLVNVMPEQVSVHNLKYIDFLLPGLVALSIMQLGLFSVAFVFVEYKQRGILKRILATPVKPYQFVLANIITRFIMSFIQAALFITLGVLLFGVTIVGSYWLIALVVALGASLFLSLGFIISGIAKTTDSVPALANLVAFPMMFLGGIFFSIDAMPVWLQYISRILPITYFSTALRDIMNKGADFNMISFNVGILIIWVVVLVSLAIYTFQFEEKM
jgi:ABC-2 type transport system permease protein